MPELSEVADALKQFGGDPQRGDRLASILGFEPLHVPVDLLGGRATPISSFLDARFGVSELYRAGGIDTGTGSVGLYIAVLGDWGARSSDRDRPRRRTARALVEYQQDARSMFIMVPNALQKRREAEFVLPRSTADLRKQSASSTVVSTVRALISLDEPTRFHRELLRDLAVRPGASLLDISRQWQKAFSVERVTKVFYQEYAKVRDRVAEALIALNPDHPVVREMTDDDARAWATRQLGRILFLWFMQSKRWLGYDWPDQESSSYLLKLWTKRDQAPNGFYRGMLIPLFFEAMARRNPGDEVRGLLGYTPYLNGGLFRRNRLEDHICEGGEVTLPDELFNPRDEMSVLGLLSRYRFTTRESTPDDQSVDPDPELLGRVFENLYQGDERHDTGTYYTPREIVQFMCRQALNGYLRDTTGVDQNTLNWLRQQVTEPDEDKRPLSPATEEALINALEGIRICDPAVGSGAFLLGMMQEIVLLRRGIIHTKHHYIDPEEEDQQITAWKRHAITWNLYGVDINPEAVDICHLRLWLSLVLDLKDPRRIDPLPNLDFCIVAGDSLIDRVADITFTESLPRGAYQPPLELGRSVSHEEEQIDRWRREFEATQDNPARLRELRDNIARAQLRIVRLHLDAAINEAQAKSESVKKKKAAQAVARVAHLNKLREGLNANAPYQKPFLWPVAFPEVFQHGGFDIVLANPPYVRQEKLSPEDQESYEQAFKEVFTGTADILVFFYGRAIQILRDKGWLAFITSNKYMRAAYGQGLRGHLAQGLSLCRVIDFGDLPLFEAAGKPVAAYPAVLVGRKDGDYERDTVQVADLTHPIRSVLAEVDRAVNSENVRWALEDLGAVLEENEIPNYPQVLLSRDRWILEDPVLVRLFERLMNQGTPLGEFVKNRIYIGIKTALNEAFVINEAKRDDLVAEDQRSTELITPWLRGRDIKRWNAEWPGLYIIAIQNSGDSDATHPWANARSETEARQIFKATYPAIHDHLSCWEAELRKRSDQGRFWWELRACAYYSEFARPKIIWPDIASTMRFASDTSGALIDMTGFLTPELKAEHMVIMNSPIAQFLLTFLTYSLRGGYLRLKTQYMSLFPMPMIANTLKRALLQCSYQTDDELAGELAIEAYGLSTQERNLLEDWQSNIEAFSDPPESYEETGGGEDV